MTLNQYLENNKARFFSLLVPLCLFFINFLLKIRFVSYPSLANDEPFSVYYAQFDVGTIISELSQGNNPPLYEIFLHYWIEIFGISEFWVRFPSVAFSSITVIFIYQICRNYFDMKVALLAAALFTFSNYQLDFSHEARVYPLFMLLSTISMYMYFKLISFKFTKTEGLVFAFINIFLLYSHFFGWFVLFVQAFYSVVHIKEKKEQFVQFAKYFILTLLFYWPYLPVLVSRFFASSGGTWVTPVSDLRPLHTFFASLVNESYVGYVFVIAVFWMVIQRYLATYFKNNLIKIGLTIFSIIFVLISLSLKLPLFRFGNEFIASPVIIFSFLAFYLFLLVHFLVNNNRNNAEKVLFSWLLIPGFFLFVVSFLIPMFLDRYLIFLTPAFFIVLAVAIQKLDPKLANSVGLLTLALMMFSFARLNNNGRDVKNLVENVKEMHKDGNSAVFICPDYFGSTFAYYYNPTIFSNTKSGVPNLDMENDLRTEQVFLVKNAKMVDSICQANRYDKIIYLDAAADFSYSNNNIKSYFKAQFQGKDVKFDSLYVPKIFQVYSYTQAKN